jgi:DNA helicase-2/ATP-dependent DNA helicase PcrA
MGISPDFEKEYARLNEAQRRAVDTTEGPVLVVAGPGTGKTQVLALRVANILRTTGVSPHNVLCLTFTDNAAMNMRERLHRYIGQDAYRVGIFTFHSFCNSIIARYPEYFFNAATYTPATDLDRAEIFQEIFSALPHDHPLQSFHPTQGFIFLPDTAKRIADLKKGGYSPDDLSGLLDVFVEEYACVEAVLRDWPKGRGSMKQLPDLAQIALRLRGEGGTTGAFLAGSLEQSIARSEEIGKTEPISVWRKKYTTKGEDETIHLKDLEYFPKMRAVAEIYHEYMRLLHERGLYDYDDMIIEVNKALRREGVLRSELEEQYQYILVDEFQDTNDAQMELVRAITSHPVHEERPNVMVVGDDDQAIYKFQGAEISNIIHFRDRTYRDVTTIVLDTNYRSHQGILDYARAIVTQGEDRLERRYGDIAKVLRQGNSNIDEGKITVTRYATDIDEYTSVAHAVREAIDRGVPPEEIAIISRKHEELKMILPFLDAQDIPYEYSKRANVFTEPHVAELVAVCEYASSLIDQGERKDFLLPKILSFPYWNIPREELFALAVSAKDAHRSWATLLSTWDHPSVKKAHEVIARLGAESASLPLEHFLEYYMNASGFKEYYFSSAELKEHPVSYVHFLSSLKTFIEALREWRSKEILYAGDVSPFVSAHEKSDISLVSDSPFVKAEHAVILMTAHGAKGLEFEVVFIISAHDKKWTRGGMANKVPIPIPLVPLVTPAGNDEDDFIRLIYVAITRAKCSLAISGHEDLLRYLDEATVTPEVCERAEPLPVSAHETALSLVSAPYKEDEWAILRRLVSSYRMSPTHLTNFLDVSEGGPLRFIEQNLLQFPQPKSPSLAFGSAVHAGIEEIVSYPKYHGGEGASLERILQVFRHELAKGRLTPPEHRKQEKRGVDLLTRYFPAHGSEFLIDDEIEVNMKDEGVVVDGAVLTGKIDLLRTENAAYVVRDWKTGKSLESWDPTGGDIHQKLKSYHYRQQLLFYKILLTRSVHYHLPVASLEIEFVEDILKKDTVTRLSYTPTKEEEERFLKLIGAVYQKIAALEFPDITRYPKTLEGVIAFEDDLINGAV